MIDDVILGNAAGGGGNIARLAALAAGLPINVPGVTVDRQCGSGLEAIIMASRMVQSGAGACFLAGGVESISRAPWRVEKPRRKTGLPRFYNRARFSPDELGDPEMGVAADNVARICKISRERQDAFALRSHQRAIASRDSGAFRQEIVPIKVKGALIAHDECPRRDTTLDALSALQPVFVADGTVTAGNSCPLNDGASMAIVMSRTLARDLRLSKGLAFVDAAAAGVDPNLLGLGPVESTKRLLKRHPSLALEHIDLIEFNEAFAAQVLGSLDLLTIAENRVNREGGALALGHPFGASGAILVTRLFAQSSRHDTNCALGMAMLGIGGGLGLSALFQWIGEL
jgi:acetyl-CoA C-acetyltransferase